MDLEFHYLPADHQEPVILCLLVGTAIVGSGSDLDMAQLRWVTALETAYLVTLQLCLITIFASLALEFFLSSKYNLIYLFSLIDLSGPLAPVTRACKSTPDTSFEDTGC
jgi:hypothetical protein